MNTTRAILKETTSIQAISDYIKKREKFQDITPFGVEGFFIIYFRDRNGIEKMMGVETNVDKVLRDYGIKGVLCSMPSQGYEFYITKGLCEHFGGHFSQQSFDDDYGFELISEEKFFAKSENDKLDEFKDEVIFKLGEENLDVVIELFEKYKNIFCP